MQADHIKFLTDLAEKTARAVLPLHGCGDKEKADGLCVSNLRDGFKNAPFQATVIIGEGEKDHAPMLYRGETLGNKDAPQKYDLAIDPLECTSFFANGLGNSLVVMALTPQKTMMDCADSHYMDKMALPKKAKGRIDKKFLQGPIDYQKFLPHLADILGKNVSELTIYMLEKERHKEIKKSVMSHGAKMIAIPAGDIAGAILAMTEKKHHGKIMVDALLGIGGAPEGVITAVAAKILGAEFFGRFAPQSDDEKKRLLEKKYDMENWFGVDDFIKGSANNMAVILTGITDGMVVQGVLAKDNNHLVLQA